MFLRMQYKGGKKESTANIITSAIGSFLIALASKIKPVKAATPKDINIIDMNSVPEVLALLPSLVTKLSVFLSKVIPDFF